MSGAGPKCAEAVREIAGLGRHRQSHAGSRASLAQRSTLAAPSRPSALAPSRPRALSVPHPQYNRITTYLYSYSTYLSNLISMILSPHKSTVLCGLNIYRSILVRISSRLLTSSNVFRREMVLYILSKKYFMLII